LLAVVLHGSAARPRQRATSTHPRHPPLLQLEPVLATSPTRSDHCSTPYLKYHPVLPCHSQTRTQTFPTRPQGSLLLPHHHRFSPYPLPHIPTATSDSDVPLAGATIPDAMSLHLVPPVHSAYEASCARHRWFRIARRHCEDLRALLLEMAVLYCCRLT
jgi:hypothetical protein